VNALGQVMGNSVGSATITVTTQDGGYSSSATIEVTHPTQGRILKVMPLGNSITEGYTIPGGYRLKLWQNLENAGLECGVDLVGSLHNNSTADLDDPDHEGHSGWTTGQILADIDNFMALATPDIVMMHLGTNDIAQGTEDETPANLRALIDHISGALPADGKLYVAEIIPIGGVGNGVSLAYNQMIADAVTEKQNQGLPVYLVDAYSIWPAGDSFYIDDWTHPNQQGYNALGDFWFDVIKGDIQLSCEGMVIKPGDVNSDGSVNLADAIITLQVLTGSSTTVTKDADVNGDNKIGIEEALHILQIQ
jgi:lysophospholipase L1-like esterase